MNTLTVKAFICGTALLFLSCRHTGTETALLMQKTDALVFDREILAAQKLDWSPKSQYVGMKIPYEPVDRLKKDIEAREGLTLQGRGEAHLTVITPPEMTVLRTRLSLEQINGLMHKSALQNTPFQVECLGRGELKQGPRKLVTFYIVVKSSRLLQIREKLRQQFVAAGGDKQAFVVERFHPHITVGFTERDLHLEDGVIKDARSCVYKLE